MSPLWSYLFDYAILHLLAESCGIC
jgi:hypothetical protein